MAVDWEPARQALAAGWIVEQVFPPADPVEPTTEECRTYMQENGVNASYGVAAADSGDWVLRLEPG